MSIRRYFSTLALGAALVLGASHVRAASDFVLFESGHVRPLAIASDGDHLFAVNTPDNRLEVFEVRPNKLVHEGSVSVGLEPVAVAVRSDTEVWVTNLLSDSVSIVDVSDPKNPRIKRTLLVGDEPRDVVFAGPGGSRAFVTAAHRGQNVPYDPEFTTPGVGRADVWVFDADDLGDPLAGTPLTIVSLFTDTPRALAVSPDGSRVYAAGFHTGNRTTVIPDFLANPPQKPAPLTNFLGEPQPPSPLIVQYDGTGWIDEDGVDHGEFVRFDLPDKDVFSLDANADPPVVISGASYPGVGTVLYNMAVNPVSGKVYVSNTEALNLNRFEGPGVHAGHTVRGNHNLNRITILGPTGSVTARHINKHIDFSTCCAALPNAEASKSLAIPIGMAVSSDGSTLYVAAMGSGKVGVYDTAALESDTFVPSVSHQIPVSGGGPTGLVLDEAHQRLYVLTRFDNGIAVVNTVTQQEVQKVWMFNPEPTDVTDGRRFLYDATLSSHGDSACATCHVFGDNDSLAWDLGNPDGTYQANMNPRTLSIFPFFLPVEVPVFAPMKGPMATQSLRGMANHGPMHWRGDRTGSLGASNAQPDGGAFDENAAFLEFQAGFVDLLGRPGPIPAADMQAFSDFILKLAYPPNPVRNLDDSLTADQAAGRDVFLNVSGTVVEGIPVGPEPPSPSFVTCESCHTLDPDANAEFGVEFPGFFGTDGTSASEPAGDVFKIPHFRNLYTKVGMFGTPADEAIVIAGAPLFEPVTGLSTGHQGDQIRGFGFLHSGQFDTIARFVANFFFSQGFPFAANVEGFAFGEAGTPARRQMEAFLLAFDSNFKPIVGQQVTLSSTNGASVGSRIDLLIDRANAGDCDLVAKGKVSPSGAGFVYIPQTGFKPDKANKPSFTDAALRAEVDKKKETLTYTCVPPGSGVRIGIDRDRDGILDSDE